MLTCDPQTERRRHPRFDGDDHPLRLGRRSGQLVDWSAGGVAVRVREGTDGYGLGAPVTVSVPGNHTRAVAVFGGRIQWIDPASGLVGVAFVDDGESAVRLLIELVGAMLKGGISSGGTGACA